MVNIREMAISDYDSVIALWCQTEGMSIRDADSKESIGNYLDRNPGLSFVAEITTRSLVLCWSERMDVVGIYNT